MQQNDLFSVHQDKILSVFHFDTIDFWKSIKDTNFYGVFLLSPKNEFAKITLEKQIFSSNSESIVCFFPFQNLEFQGDFKGQLLLFHPNFFCVDIQASDYGCQGVLFQNIYRGSFSTISTEHSNQLKIKIKEIESEIVRNEYGQLESIANSIRNTLIICLRVFRLTKNEIEENKKIIQFKELLNEKVYFEHRPNFYAKELKMSFIKLNELLKEKYQKTTSEIIHDKLITLAKSNLFLTEYSVKEISNQLGFEDPLYFSRFFKKKTGISPIQFRKQVKENYLSI